MLDKPRMDLMVVAGLVALGCTGGDGCGTQGTPRCADPNFVECQPVPQSELGDERLARYAYDPAEITAMVEGTWSGTFADGTTLAVDVVVDGALEPGYGVPIASGHAVVTEADEQRCAGMTLGAQITVQSSNPELGEASTWIMVDGTELAAMPSVDANGMIIGAPFTTIPIGEGPSGERLELDLSFDVKARLWAAVGDGFAPLELVGARDPG